MIKYNQNRHLKLPSSHEQSFKKEFSRKLRLRMTILRLFLYQFRIFCFCLLPNDTTVKFAALLHCVISYVIDSFIILFFKDQKSPHRLLAYGYVISRGDRPSVGRSWRGGRDIADRSSRRRASWRCCWMSGCCWRCWVATCSSAACCARHAATPAVDTTLRGTLELVDRPWSTTTQTLSHRQRPPLSTHTQHIHRYMSIRTITMSP